MPYNDTPMNGEGKRHAFFGKRTSHYICVDKKAAFLKTPLFYICKCNIMYVL